MSPASSTPVGQILLLSPPSLSSHPETLENIIHSQHGYSETDLQMLDRVAFGLASLPASTYDTIVVLADVEGSYREANTLAERGVLRKVAESLKPGGRLCSQDGILGLQGDSCQTEAILAGLVNDENGTFVKPNFGDQHSVPLHMGAKKHRKLGLENGRLDTQQPSTVPLGVSEHNRAKGTRRTGVGFIEPASDFAPELETSLGEYAENDLIDENDLLDESDLGRPIIQRKCFQSNRHHYRFFFVMPCSY